MTQMSNKVESGNLKLPGVCMQSVEDFVEDENLAYSLKTKESYLYCLKRFLTWLEENQVYPEKVTPKILRLFLDQSNWSSNMRRLYGNSIKSYYRWAFGDDSPLINVKLPKDNAAAGRWLDYQQILAVADQFDQTRPEGIRNLAMLWVMIETGLRASEVCRLELKFLDVKKREFRVIAKGGKWRTGSLSIETMAALSAWLNIRKQYAKPGCGNVFVSVYGKRPGTQMTPSGLRANFARLGMRSGIGRLSPHDLRRTMANLYTDLGAPSRWTMEAGNWKDFNTFMRYTKSLKLRDIERWSPVVHVVNQGKAAG